MKTGTVIMQFFLVVGVVGIGFWMALEAWMEWAKKKASEATRVPLLLVQGTLRKVR